MSNSGQKVEGLRRTFAGKLNNFKDKAEARFQKRALKAYLKGQPYFRMGFNKKGNPQYHITPEQWITQEEYDKKLQGVTAVDEDSIQLTEPNEKV